jgi:hypothetical protein
MTVRDREPTMEELMRAWLDRHEIEVRGPMPGRVTRYDPSNQTADVQPMLRLPVEQSDGSVTQEDPPIIPCVPVIFPRVGQWFMSLPIAAGDYVLLVPCEGDWSRWWGGDGSLSDVDDVRRHHLAHCVALAGFFPERLALTRTLDAGSSGGQPTGLVIGSDSANGARIQLRANGNAEIVTGGSGGAQVTVKPDKVVEISQNGSVVARIDADGIVHLGGVAGDLVALAHIVNSNFATLRSDFNSHTHNLIAQPVTNATPAAPGPVTVSGATAVPTPLLVTFDDVACTKVKAH